MEQENGRFSREFLGDRYMSRFWDRQYSERARSSEMQILTLPGLRLEIGT